MAGQFWGGGFLYVTVDGTAQLPPKISQLATFGERITSLQEPFTQIGEDFLADFAQNMASEGGLYGTWAPLAASTIADRQRKGFGPGPILFRRGDLAASLSERGSADNIFEVTPTSLRVGTRDRKAPFHQRGTRKMPQRKIVGMTWNRRQLIIRRLGDWVREQVAAAGLGA